jgi:hypothetical protein
MKSDTSASLVLFRPGEEDEAVAELLISDRECPENAA